MDARIWTVADAKARLSEILRLAAEEGPQRIGARRGYVLVTEEQWHSLTADRPPMGRWLLENIEPGEPLDLPDRAEPLRDNPFAGLD